MKRVLGDFQSWGWAFRPTPNSLLLSYQWPKWVAQPRLVRWVEVCRDETAELKKHRPIGSTLIWKRLRPGVSQAVDIDLSGQFDIVKLAQLVRGRQHDLWCFAIGGSKPVQPTTHSGVPAGTPTAMGAAEGKYVFHQLCFSGRFEFGLA